MELGTEVRIVRGAFAGHCGAVVHASEDRLRVHIVLFGREVDVEVPEEDVRGPGVDPLKMACERIERDTERWVAMRLDAWWRERVYEPETEPLEELDAANAFERQLRAEARKQLEARLEQFEQRAADAVEALLEEERAQWLPGEEATERQKAAWRDDEDAFMEFAAAQDVGRRRQEKARRAGQWRNYTAWAAANRPAAEEQQARVRKALGELVMWKKPLRKAVRDLYGIALPDALFEYWGWKRSLDPGALEALHEVGVSPGGLCDVLDALVETEGKPSGLQTRDGLDVRLEGRFYKDPPEFFTFAHGNTDGLHYGLWYDDPNGPARGVASHHARNDDGIQWHRSSLLGLVREKTIEYEAAIEQDTSLEMIDDGDLREQMRFRAFVVLQALEAWSRDGKAKANDELDEVPDKERFMTADGAGAVAPGEPAEHRLAGNPTRLREAVEHHLESCVRAADKALEKGDPTEALCFGRDLHWCSNDDPAREKAARDLLVRAYRALGRDALAAIAEVHGSCRRLRSVAVLLRR